MYYNRLILLLVIVCFSFGVLGISLAQKGLPEPCIKLKGNVKIKQLIGGVSTEVTYKDGVIIAPGPVKAGECPEFAPSGIANECSGTEITGTCYTLEFGAVMLMSMVNRVTNWLFLILMAAVTLMIIYGGFLYVTAAGDPEKAGKGRQVLTLALVGFVIAILAKILPAFVKYFIGVGGSGGGAGGG